MSTDADIIDCESLLGQLLSSTSLDEHREELNQFCRKVSVAKVVASSYTSDWKKREPIEPLSAKGWEEMVKLMLRGCKDYPDEMSWKCLNALFKALDHIEENHSCEQLTAWREEAETLLEEKAR